MFIKKKPQCLTEEDVCVLIVPVELQDRLRLSFVGSQPPCDCVWRVIVPLDQSLPGDVIQSLQRMPIAFSPCSGDYSP